MERAWIRIIILNYGIKDTIIPNDNNNGFDFARYVEVEEIVSVWMNEIEIDMNDDIFWNWQFSGKMSA